MRRRNFYHVGPLKPLGNTEPGAAPPPVPIAHQERVKYVWKGPDRGYEQQPQGATPQPKSRKGQCDLCGRYVGRGVGLHRRHCKGRQPVWQEELAGAEE